MQIRKVLQKSCLFFIAVILMPASSAAASQEAHPTPITRSSPAASPAQDAPFAIGGFNLARGGDGASIQQGANFSGARASIARNFPNASFVSFKTLDPVALNGVALLFLTSAYTGTTAITPLSASEQGVLWNYVKNGGCAILMTDHDHFGGIPASSIANQSLLEPFNVVSGGYIADRVTATVIDPPSSLVTNGSFGTVASFLQNFAGDFSSDGIYAKRVANNSLGGALDMIEADAIGPGSGPVILFSDVNTFWDDNGAELGFFYENEALFVNTIHFCMARSSTQFYSVSGKVTDSGGIGIPNTLVYASNWGRAVTDAQGNYTISSLPAGSYTIKPQNPYYFFSPDSSPFTAPPSPPAQNFTGTASIVSFLPFVSR